MIEKNKKPTSEQIAAAAKDAGLSNLSTGVKYLTLFWNSDHFLLALIEFSLLGNSSSNESPGAVTNYEFPWNISSVISFWRWIENFIIAQTLNTVKVSLTFALTRKHVADMEIRTAEIWVRRKQRELMPSKLNKFKEALWVLIFLIVVITKSPEGARLYLGTLGYYVHKHRDSAEWQAERCPVSAALLCRVIKSRDSNSGMGYKSWLVYMY